MKNIVISNYDDIYNPDYAGGGAIAIKRLSEYLSSKYRVTVITGTYPGAKNEKLDGVNYIRIGSYVFGGKIGQLFYLMMLPIAALTQKCDIWIDSFTPPFSVSLIPLFIDKNKVLGLVHMLSGTDMRRKYKLPFDWLQNVGLKFYKQFIVLTKLSENEILKHNSKAKVYVIPNGIDIPDERLLNIKKNKQILFLGRIEVNQKGLDLLIQVFKKILETVNCKLIIAGAGAKKEVSDLKSLIKLYNLEKKVKLVGRVDGKNKDILIRKSIMVVIPSRFETFSITALEAMANKSILVSFDIDGFKWIENGASVKINMFDVTKMSEYIVKLLKNRSLRRSFQETAYKFVQNYSFDMSLEKYNEVIRKIIK